MTDASKHRFFIFQILKDIFSDIELANYLGLKGETALFLFTDFPRISIDVDFNLLDHSKEKIVMEKLRSILMQHENIFDLAIIFFGQIIALNRGRENKKVKIEISKIEYVNNYEIKNLLGINMPVLTLPDMLSHKLCDLSDNFAINRTVFDSWFMMKNNTPVNRLIIETRTKMQLPDYLQKCINKLENMYDKDLLEDLEETVNTRMQNFIKTKLLSETIDLLQQYKNSPKLVNYGLLLF
jgi:hypothetical protein